MSLCSVASPLAMEPKIPAMAMSFCRQISCSFLMSKGNVCLGTPWAMQGQRPAATLSQTSVQWQAMPLNRARPPAARDGGGFRAANGPPQVRRAAPSPGPRPPSPRGRGEGLPYRGTTGSVIRDGYSAEW